MKIRSKQILTLYFNSWWFPAVFFLAVLAVFTMVAVAQWRPLAIVANVLLVCLGIAFLGILSVSIWNLIKKRWAKGVVNLVMLPVCGVAAFVAFGFLVFASLFGPSEDGFADNLTIPEDITLSEPKQELDAEPGGPEDTFQAALLAALKIPGSGDVSVTADIASLVRLQQQSPDILKRYLATSPSWRVFREHGSIFATRRWMIGSEWRYDLHGYYSRHDIDTWSKASIPDFQLRFTIGFSGKPWARVSGDATKLKVGERKPPTLSIGNQMHESRCIIAAGYLVVEVFEQSEAKERRLTKAALAHIENEVNPLVEQPTWETIWVSLPAGSIRRGEPSFELRNSFQPGIYDSEIWVNPGEPGMIYLKAFEVTEGTPLSVYRLKDRSNEWIGWSDVDDELFFSNTHFTIYEGDWGKSYAARFEVWFVPDSGGPERTLMEKIFKIEGWQR